MCERAQGRKSQGQRLKVNRADCGPGGERAAGDHRRRADERGTGAIDAQRRECAEAKPGVRERENHERVVAMSNMTARVYMEWDSVNGSISSRSRDPPRGCRSSRAAPASPPSTRS
jgi:hypothetical protein